MKDLFECYSLYSIETKKYSGKMGTPMKKNRSGSTLYANKRNRLKKNKSNKR